jgi:peroxiredoxin
VTDPGHSIDLPAPEDDGAADHLPGRQLPPIELPATDGQRVRLDQLATRSVVFVYPAIGGPGNESLLEEWTALPGARGCTPEACGFRDEFSDFQVKGVEVLGLSSQPTSIQHSHVQELGLRYPLLSDERLRLADELGLPTFDFHGERYYRRLTLVVDRAAIEAALYPVFPPDQGAAQALRWLGEHRRTA